MSWYEIKLDMDGDTFMATAPAFPEVTTFGDSIESAMASARDAVEEAIAARIAEGEDIPGPRLVADGCKYSIELPALALIKAALYMFCKEQGVTRAELCRRLGWHREQADRLFRLDHNSRLDQLESAFKAIGISITLSTDVGSPTAWAA